MLLLTKLPKVIRSITGEAGMSSQSYLQESVSIPALLFLEREHCTPTYKSLP